MIRRSTSWPCHQSGSRMGKRGEKCDSCIESLHENALFLECSLICLGYCYGASGHHSRPRMVFWLFSECSRAFRSGLFAHELCSICLPLPTTPNATEARLKKLEAAAVAFHRLNKIYVHSFICGNGKRACTSRAPYRVAKQVSDLGWVDSDFTCSLILLGQ